MSFQTYNVYEGLTSAKLASTANVVGNYFNGPVNNGVDSTLTTTSGVLVIDTITVEEGDSILLVGQTNANENGIYVVIQTGTDFISTVLKRRNDFHTIEQMKIGQYITIGDGSANSGSLYIVINPLPSSFGIDPIVFKKS